MSKYNEQDASMIPYVDPNVDINQHVVTNASGTKCKICERVYIKTPPSRVKSHVYRHLGVKPFSCIVCGKRFLLRIEAVLHSRTQHKEKPFSCVVCQRKYATKAELNYHAQSHDTTNMLSCHYCQKTFCAKKFVRMHLQRVHVSRDFLCQICAKSYKCADALLRHKEIVHLAIKNMKCPICEKLFHEHYFKSHVQTHSKERPFTCDTCKETFATRTSLIKHVKKHDSTITPTLYKCNLCEKAYTSLNTLDEHKLKHRGIRKFVCQVCNKDFAQQSHLDAHKFSHMERKFECHLCGAKFNRNDNRKSHVKKHETSARLKKLEKVKN